MTTKEETKKAGNEEDVRAMLFTKLHEASMALQGSSDSAKEHNVENRVKAFTNFSSGCGTNLNIPANRSKERQKDVEQLKKAIRLFDQGLYGICQFENSKGEKCGEPVGEKRLAAKPGATLCVDCAKKKEKEEEENGTNLEKSYGYKLTNSPHIY